MKNCTIRFGRAPEHSIISHSADAAASGYDEKRIFARAALLALCGSIVCVSFLAYSAAPRDQAVVQVMARPADTGDGGAAVPTVSANNDGSLWSYIEGVIRGIIDDAGD